MSLLNVTVKRAKYIGVQDITAAQFNTYVTLKLQNVKSTTVTVRGSEPCWEQDFLFETNTVRSGLLVEVWTKGMIWDRALGYQLIALDSIQYSPVETQGQWYQLDMELILMDGEVAGTRNPTGHMILLDCRFELPFDPDTQMTGDLQRKLEMLNGIMTPDRRHRQAQYLSNSGYSEDSDYTSDLSYPVGQNANSSASQYRNLRSLETSRENSYEKDGSYYDNYIIDGKQALDDYQCRDNENDPLFYNSRPLSTNYDKPYPNATYPIIRKRSLERQDTMYDGYSTDTYNNTYCTGDQVVVGEDQCYDENSDDLSEDRQWDSGGRGTSMNKILPKIPIKLSNSVNDEMFHHGGGSGIVSAPKKTRLLPQPMLTSTTTMMMIGQQQGGIGFGTNRMLPQMPSTMWSKSSKQQQLQQQQLQQQLHQRSDTESSDQDSLQSAYSCRPSMTVTDMATSRAVGTISYNEDYNYAYQSTDSLRQTVSETSGIIGSRRRKGATLPTVPCVSKSATTTPLPPQIPNSKYDICDDYQDYYNDNNTILTTNVSPTLTSITMSTVSMTTTSQLSMLSRKSKRLPAMPTVSISNSLTGISGTGIGRLPDIPVSSCDINSSNSRSYTNSNTRKKQLPIITAPDVDQYQYDPMDNYNNSYNSSTVISTIGYYDDAVVPSSTIPSTISTSTGYDYYSNVSTTLPSSTSTITTNTIDTAYDIYNNSMYTGDCMAQTSTMQPTILSTMSTLTGANNNYQQFHQYDQQNELYDQNDYQYDQQHQQNQHESTAITAPHYSNNDYYQTSNFGKLSNTSTPSSVPITTSTYFTSSTNASASSLMGSATVTATTTPATAGGIGITSITKTISSIFQTKLGHQSGQSSQSGQSGPSALSQPTKLISNFLTQQQSKLTGGLTAKLSTQTADQQFNNTSYLDSDRYYKTTKSTTTLSTSLTTIITTAASTNITSTTINTPSALQIATTSATVPSIQYNTLGQQSAIPIDDQYIEDIDDINTMNNDYNVDNYKYEDYNMTGIEYSPADFSNTNNYYNNNIDYDDTGIDIDYTNQSIISDHIGQHKANDNNIILNSKNIYCDKNVSNNSSILISNKFNQQNQQQQQQHHQMHHQSYDKTGKPIIIDEMDNYPALATGTNQYNDSSMCVYDENVDLPMKSTSANQLLNNNGFMTSSTIMTTKSPTTISMTMSSTGMSQSTTKTNGYYNQSKYKYVSKTDMYDSEMLSETDYIDQQSNQMGQQQQQNQESQQNQQNQQNQQQHYLDDYFNEEDEYKYLEKEQEEEAKGAMLEAGSDIDLPYEHHHHHRRSVIDNLNHNEKDLDELNELIEDECDEEIDDEEELDEDVNDDVVGDDDEDDDEDIHRTQHKFRNQQSMLSTQQHPHHRQQKSMQKHHLSTQDSIDDNEFFRQHSKNALLTLNKQESIQEEDELMHSPIGGTGASESIIPSTITATVTAAMSTTASIIDRPSLHSAGAALGVGTRLIIDAVTTATTITTSDIATVTNVGQSMQHIVNGQVGDDGEKDHSMMIDKGKVGGLGDGMGPGVGGLGDEITGGMSQLRKPEITAKQRWNWAFNKIIMQLNVSRN